MGTLSNGAGLGSQSHSSSRMKAGPNINTIRPKRCPPRPVNFCRECGYPYWPRRDDQEYCAPTCRSKYHKRRYERGAQLYDFAMEWRGKRLKDGMTKLCQIIDEWLRDKRERHRVHRKLRESWLKQNQG